MLPNTGPHLHAFALDLNLHAFVIRMTRWREGRATLNSAEDDHRAMLPGICSAPQWRRCSKIEREITRERERDYNALQTLQVSFVSFLLFRHPRRRTGELHLDHSLGFARVRVVLPHNTDKPCRLEL